MPLAPPRIRSPMVAEGFLDVEGWWEPGASLNDVTGGIPHAAFSD